MVFGLDMFKGEGEVADGLTAGAQEMDDCGVEVGVDLVQGEGVWGEERKLGHGV